MRTKRPGAWRVPSFEALMENAYGVDDQRLLRPAESAGRLLERYYGYQPKSKRKNGCAPRCTLHVDCDDANHTLAQRPRTNGRAAAPAPVAKLPVPAPATSPPIAARAAPVAAPVAPATPAVAPAELAPVAAAPITAAPSAAVSATNAPATAPAIAPAPNDAGLTQRLETNPANTTTSEDDFISDMKSILDGTGAYDDRTKKIVPRKQLEEFAREESRAQSARGGNGAGESDNGQAIFDRIARSMKYAGAYDLGEVELENRFADFDRMDELRNKPKKPARKGASGDRRPPSTGSPLPIDSADFIEDLEAIQKQSINEAEALRDSSIDIANAMKPELSNPASVPSRYSRPFYGTGEHARMGAGLYEGQLMVGKSPGLAFSYGELIAMGDFFDDVDQLMGESVAKLTELRGLIRDEVAGRSVSTKQWMSATRDRYLKLAEDNYEHFAPNLFFQSKKFPRSLEHRNHRQAWEKYHERAIKEAQQMGLDPGLAKTSYVPEWPLIINAFGDHFMTDAFAAGHVINKQEIIELFKSRFYKGSSLTDAANSFFDKVATAAWKGEVAAEFKQLETYDEYFLWWNPDIKNAERFSSVLKGIAGKEPDKIANLAVKAIHDHYNENGIEVSNAAGHKPWKLTGDGFLTPVTLKVIETAVRESAAHITDSSILASNISFPNYFAKVWDHVPKLTSASTAAVTKFVDGFISPSSSGLVTKAAKLINDEVTTLVQQLIDAKALQRI